MSDSIKINLLENGEFNSRDTASKTVGDIVSTSYPLTNAFPGEALYNAKSSEGTHPVGVN